MARSDRVPARTHVICTFVNGKLIFVAENDYDPERLNLMDALSDNICAYVEPPRRGGAIGSAPPVRGGR